MARYFIGTATTEYAPHTGLDNRPELMDELTRARSMFARLGYEIVTGFTADMNRDLFLRRLRSFLRDSERRDNDVVVVYYTGHGVAGHDGLLLPMADSDDDLAFSAMAATDLTSRVMAPYGDDDVAGQQVLIILDTCHGGAAAAGIANGLINFQSRLQGRAIAPTAALIVATRDYESARPGAFTQALAEAIDSQAVASEHVPYLSLDALVDVVDAQTPDHQHAKLIYSGQRAGAFFPNGAYERWYAQLDQRSKAIRDEQAARERDRQNHVRQRAQGLDAAAPNDELWLFTGRTEALRSVCYWLNAPHPTTLIVTGQPGCGKSALLSRIDVLADPRRRSRVPDLHQLPSDTLPPLNSVQRFIHARGQTPQTLLAALGEACGMEDITSIDSPGRLISRLQGIHEPITIVIDALDEAISAPDQPLLSGFPIVEHVLAPLVTAASRTPLRLILGTRSNLVAALGQPAAVLDLDDPKYADGPSMQRYVRLCLTELADTSPYQGQALEYLDAVARAVARNAGRSFLVALISARSLAMRPDRPDNPLDPQWLSALPREGADAMRRDLEMRLDEQAQRARDLLLPLAYAGDLGLPWETLWPELVRALTGRPCTNADLDWLMREAGFYIVETIVEERSVYRLFHESLAQHLRDGRDVEADHGAIVDLLIRRTPLRRDGSVDWLRAHPYTAASIAKHAADAGRLDQLLTDPRFILYTPAPPLLAVRGQTRTAEGYAAASAVGTALRQFRWAPHEHRGAYLQLAARCTGAQELAEAINDCGLPLAWSTSWASWRPRSVHHALSGHTGYVCAVAFGNLDDRTIVVSGSDDQTIRVWDAATGHPIGEPLTGHAGPIYCLAVTNVGGRTVIVSGSEDQTLRIWNAASGEIVGQPLTGHTGWVRTVEIGQLHQRTVIVSGGDQTVRLWDLDTGQPIGQPLVGHTDWVRSVAIASIEESPVIVSAGDDRTIRLWDADTGAPVGPPLTGHNDWVRSVAVVKTHDRDLLVSASDDESVRVWDLLTREPIAQFSGHSGPVFAVATGVLEGQAVAVSGGDDRTVRIWDVQTGDQIGDPIDGHSGYVCAVAVGWLHERAIIASGGAQAVHLWDARTGDAVGVPFAAHTGPVYSVAFGDLRHKPIIVSGGDQTVRLWDAASGSPLDSPAIEGLGWVNCVALGSAGDQRIIASGDDNRIRAWDAATMEPLFEPLEEHTDLVRDLAFGHVGGEPVLISGSDDGTVCIWDALTGRLRNGPLAGHRGPVNAIAVTTIAGRTVAASGGADGTVRLWDVKSGTALGDPFEGHTDWVRALTFAELQGRVFLVSAGDDAAVLVWDTTTGRLAGGPLTGHTGEVNAIAADEIDDRIAIVSAGRDATIRLWDLETRAPIQTPFTGNGSPIYAIALGDGPQGKVIVTGSEDKAVRLWNPSLHRRPSQAFTGHSDWVRSVCSGQVDGRIIAVSGGDDCTVRRWDAASGEQLGDPITGHSDWVRTTAFGWLSAQPVIITGSDDRTVRVWDARTGHSSGPPMLGHTGRIFSLTFSKIGSAPIAISGGDNTVRFWNLSTGEQHGHPVVSHTGRIFAVSVTDLGNATVVAFGGSDGTIRRWDPVNWRPLGEPMHGHSGYINALTFVHCSGQTLLASAGSDGTVRLWDAETGESLGQPLLGHAGPVYSARFMHGSEKPRLITGSNDRTVRLWDLYDSGALSETSETSNSLIIDVGAAVYGIAVPQPGQIVAATASGLVSLRPAEPMSGHIASAQRSN